jgi:hypothetical protein
MWVIHGDTGTNDTEVGSMEMELLRLRLPR